MRFLSKGPLGPLLTTNESAQYLDHLSVKCQKLSKCCNN